MASPPAALTRGRRLPHHEAKRAETGRIGDLSMSKDKTTRNDPDSINLDVVHELFRRLHESGGVDAADLDECEDEDDLSVTIVRDDR